MALRELTRQVRAARGAWFSEACPEDVIYIDHTGVPALDGLGFSVIERVRLTPAERVRRGRVPLEHGRHIALRGQSWSELKVDGETLVALTGELVPIVADVDAAVGYPQVVEAFESGVSTAEVSLVPGIYGHRTPEPRHHSLLIVRVEADGAILEWQTFRVDNSPVKLGRLMGEAYDVLRDGETGDMIVAGRDAHGLGGIFRLAALPPAEDQPPCRATLAETWDPPPLHPVAIGRPVQLAESAAHLFAVDADRGVVWYRERALAEIPPARGREPALREAVAGLDRPSGLAVADRDGELTLVVADASGLHVFSTDSDALSDAHFAALEAGAPKIPLPEATGQLAWADRAEARVVVVPLPDDGRVLLIDVERTDPEPIVAAEGLEAPRALQVLPEGQLLVVCEAVVGLASLRRHDDDILLGLGHVPFQAIEADGPFIGRVNTVDALPGYFFQASNALLGGALHLLVDHARAWQAGHRALRVSLIGDATERVIVDAFGDLRWDPHALRFESVRVEAGQPLASGAIVPDAYPIRRPDERWYAPHRAVVIRTRPADDGLRRLRVQFFDAGGRPAEEREVPLAIDNAGCRARLSLPRLGAGEPELVCGCLAYADKDDPLRLSLSAYHPRGEADYRVRFARGGRWLSDLPLSGVADDAQIERTRGETDSGRALTIRDLMGPCNVAHVAIDLSVSTGARVTDGYRWLGRSARHRRSFTFVPDHLALDED